MKSNFWRSNAISWAYGALGIQFVCVALDMPLPKTLQLNPISVILALGAIAFALVAISLEIAAKKE